VFAYPSIYSFFLQFFAYDLGKPYLGAVFVGLGNYVKAVHDPWFWTSISVSLSYYIGALCIELPLGMGIALLLNRQLKFERAFMTMIIVPLTLAESIVGLIWRSLYSQDFGLINYLLSLVSLPALPWLANPNVTFVGISLPLWSIIIADVWQWTPLVALLFLVGLQSLPNEPFRSARVDGASSVQMFRFLTLPMLKPVTLAILVIRTMDILTIFDKPFVMTQGGPGLSTEVMPLYAYRIGFTWFDMGYASVVAWTLMFLTEAITIGYVLLLRRD
jgi:multiple sugar transport system permease protein